MAGTILKPLAKFKYVNENPARSCLLFPKAFCNNNDRRRRKQSQYPERRELRELLRRKGNTKSTKERKHTHTNCRSKQREP
jgi:hypothetical protein